MKILIVRTYPDRLNLKSYNVQEVGLAKALTVKGHVCDVVLYNGPEDDKEEEYGFVKQGQSYYFKIYWLHGYKILKNGYMPTVNKLITQYDVIQVHEYDQLMSWNLYTKQVKPTVVYHGPYYDSFARGYNLKCKLFDFLCLSKRKYQDVVVLSKSKLATEFLHSKGFYNVDTVGVGIDLDNFGENLSLAAQIKEIDSKSLLYVGKLEERRNIYFLVEVFRKIRKKDSGLKLIIIGNGEKTYKEQFLLSIGDELEKGHIVYKESATQVELVEYYNVASFFLLPSNYEIFGMVLLEAMYFGAPVISSLNGGSSTLIQNGYNGFIMNDFDVELWADCIYSALQDENGLMKMKKNARNTIEQRYTWDVLVSRFMTGYMRAIEHFDNLENK